MKVIIAEKPSVARDIARVLGLKNRGTGFIFGDDYRVTWAVGHLVTLCDPGEMNPDWLPWRFDRLPMLPDDMRLKVVERAADQYEIVKTLICADDVSELICATDAGREGELIFRHIYNLSGCSKPFKRLWISSMTDEAIREGFASLKDGMEYQGLYLSARCRQEADWLVGMNLSRAYSLKFRARLSVGRVQTPTLALLVKRRREIENFKPETYYEVRANFGDYQGLWIDETANSSRIVEEARAKAIAAKVKGKGAVVRDAEIKREKLLPPHLFDLTSLQREANQRAGLTADQTLKAAQSLYEGHKAITYPRTDSHALPNDMYARAGQAMQSLRKTSVGGFIDEAMPGGKLPQPSRVFDDAEVSDHHAIIPTGRLPSGALTDHEQAVWELVMRRFVSAFMPDHEYETRRVITVSQGEAFISRGRTTLIEGWRKLWKDAPSLRKSTKADADGEEDSALPPLKQGDERLVEGASCTKKATKPPSQHTEATLLAAMERAGKNLDDEELKRHMKDSGLGTPATRAAIIERIITVGYAKRSGRSVLATDKGCTLIDIAPPELTSPELTGKWEKALVSMAEGSMTDERFMTGIRRFTEAMIDFTRKSNTGARFEEEKPQSQQQPTAKKPAAKPSPKAEKPESKPVCPLCGGRIIPGMKGFGCGNWRNGCGFRVFRDEVKTLAGAELDEKLMHRLLTSSRAVSFEQGSLKLMPDGTLRFTKRKPK